MIPPLLEIEDGLFIQPHKVVAVKQSGLSAKKCTIFMSGQSAMDGGFLVNRKVEDVVADLDDALSEEAGNGKGR